MEIIIQNIRFVYPGCKLLTKEKFDRSYGDKNVNGTGKPTHHNLNRHNADRVFESLKQAIKDKTEIDKRDKESAKAAKAKKVEVVKVEKSEPKKKKKKTVKKSK
jgi:hypothetical protein